MATYPTEYRYKIGDKVLVKMICTKLSRIVIVTRCDLDRVLVAGPRAPNDTSLLQELL